MRIQFRFAQTVIVSDSQLGDYDACPVSHTHRHGNESTIGSRNRQMSRVRRLQRSAPSADCLLQQILGLLIVKTWIRQFSLAHIDQLLLSPRVDKCFFTVGCYRDSDEATRERVIAWLEDHESPAHMIELVAKGGDLDAAEQQRAFGESLPQGLQIR